MIGRLVEHSLKVIEDALCRAEKPVIAWSAGKDSQVLLFLVNKVKEGIPVLHFRPFEHESKHMFAELAISTMHQQVLDVKPAAIDVVATGDHVELIEAYQLAPGAEMYFPIEAEPDHIPGPSSHCAIQRLKWPTQAEPIRIDCVFIGHRSDDVDPVHGAIPLEADHVEAAGVNVVYPLKNWTEADIWRASELFNIPQNRLRYEQSRMDWNADYWPMCTECMKPSAKDGLICPKYNHPVFAIGRHLNLEERRQNWHQRFVNLRKQDENSAS